MVLSPPAADDPLRPQTGWIEAVLRTLRLSRGGVLVHVDHAGMERLGELTRALFAEWPEMDVLDGVAGLETAPEGSTLILVPHAEDAGWLNVNRPIITRRSLRVVLYCDHATTIELNLRAPDFFDWISTHVECPKGLVPFAVAGIRAALQAGAKRIHWMGTRGGEGRKRLAELWDACVPGSTIRWIDVEGPYEEVVKRIQSAGTSSDVWLATEADAPWKVWRFRWACAEAKSPCPELVFAPDFKCGGFWPVHDAMWPLAGAILFLRGAGVERSGLLAGLLDLEGDAIEYACRLVDVASEEQMIAAVSKSEDSGVALFHWGSRSNGLPVGDPWPALVARASGEVPEGKGPFFEIEPHLRGELHMPYWFIAAQAAFTIGDKDAASRWMWRGLEANPPPEEAKEEIARLVRNGTPDQVTEALTKSLAAAVVKLTADAATLLGEQSGEQSEPFLTLLVELCKQYVDLGSPQTSVLLLSKVLGLPVNLEEVNRGSAEGLQLPALSPDLAARLRKVLGRFLTGPTPTPSPHTADEARDVLLRALHAQGRYEEAALLTSRR